MKLYDIVKTSGIDGEKNLCPFAHFFLPIKPSFVFLVIYLTNTYQGPIMGLELLHCIRNSIVNRIDGSNTPIDGLLGEEKCYK